VSGVFNRSGKIILRACGFVVHAALRLGREVHGMIATARKAGDDKALPFKV
jgi:hypothetical protein